jgi:hypothetical protein
MYGYPAAEIGILDKLAMLCPGEIDMAEMALAALHATPDLETLGVEASRVQGPMV